MKTKRMISLLLAVVLTLSVAVTPAFAASAGSELAAGKSANVEETNDVVSIRLTTSGDLVYGSPFPLSVQTPPADTQYIAFMKHGCLNDIAALNCFFQFLCKFRLCLFQFIYIFRYFKSTQAYF